MFSEPLDVSQIGARETKTILNWIRDLSLNWDSEGGMYRELLMDGVGKNRLLREAMSPALFAGNIEDLLGTLELCLNKRMQSLEIDGDQWEVVFLALYPIIQDYAMILFLAGSDGATTSPHRSIIKEITAFSTWMHVYFS